MLEEIPYGISLVMNSMNESSGRLDRTYTRSHLHAQRWTGACIDPSHPRSHGMVHRSFAPAPMPLAHLRGAVSFRSGVWTHWDLNPGHPPCKGGTLPLSYGPGRRIVSPGSS